MKRDDQTSFELPWGETTAYGRRLIAELLKRYPRGTAPLTSVELCGAWLLSNEADNSDWSRKLDMIEIDANDETWYLDGQPQGDSVDLCCWVFGRERTAGTQKALSAIIRIWYGNGVRRSRRAAWKKKASNQRVGPGTGKVPSDASPRSTPVVARHNTDKRPDSEPSRTIRPVAGCTEKPPTDTRLPQFGVTLCIRWLRELTLAAHGKEDGRLVQVRVCSDDKHWSAPGKGKSDMKALVHWITGWSSEKDHEELREHARKWRAKHVANRPETGKSDVDCSCQQEGQSCE